jgi:hypothetical protein
VGLCPDHVESLEVRANGMTLFMFTPGVDPWCGPVPGGRVLESLNELAGVSFKGQAGIGLSLFFDLDGGGLFRTIRVGGTNGTVHHLTMTMQLNMEFDGDQVDMRMFRAQNVAPHWQRGYVR